VFPRKRDIRYLFVWISFSERSSSNVEEVAWNGDAEHRYEDVQGRHSVDIQTAKWQFLVEVTYITPSRPTWISISRRFLMTRESPLFPPSPPVRSPRENSSLATARSDSDRLTVDVYARRRWATWLRSLYPNCLYL